MKTLIVGKDKNEYNICENCIPKHNESMKKLKLKRGGWKKFVESISIVDCRHDFACAFCGAPSKKEVVVNGGDE